MRSCSSDAEPEKENFALSKLGGPMNPFASFPVTLVYNTNRSGEFELGNRRFLLRRVAFPAHPTAEWFAVDLLEHAAVSDLGDA